MQKFIIILLVCFMIGSFCILEGCKKDKHTTTPLQIGIPAYFPATSFYQNNAVSAEGAALGRRLFYDRAFSKDGSISCGSCHQQIAAFGTYDHDISHGVNGEHGTRNAMATFNIAWMKSFGWDGAATDLNTIYTSHITSNVAFAETVNNVESKISRSAVYQPLFQKAFGSKEINSQRIFNALTQFLATIVSANSKYDSVKLNLTAFSAGEQLGYDIFKTKCNTCHTEPLFTDFSFRNIGLPVNYLNDRGRMKVTGNRNDSLKFRVPSLRNLFQSYPFMHDGRFIAFSQVFDHYQGGVQNGPTLDPLFASGFVLTTAERIALTDFLKTLTDYRLVANSAFAAPQ